MEQDGLRGKRVLVMGLGVNAGGLGVTRFLVSRGAEVTVTDLRQPDVLAPSLRALEGLPVSFVLGQHREEDFRDTDIVIRNPGVPRESKYLAIAREHGATIEMEMTLFFRLCPGPILGITGTRGKTTTTLLAGAMLEAARSDTVVAGNLRVSALEQLDRIGSDTPVVLELSSWQLEGLGEARLSPHLACVTNLSPDHLDRYPDMEAYGTAKKQIFLHQRPERGDRVVLNADDERVRTWIADTVDPASVVWFSTRRPAGTSLVEHQGAWWDGDILLWKGEPVCSSGDLRIAGEHNRANVAAAVALAKLYQPPVASPLIRQAVATFRGVPDRLEVVDEIESVRFINDTTATTPTATGAALHAMDRPVILIAGGADKRLEFDELAELVARRHVATRTRMDVSPIKAIVLLRGTATPRLVSALAAAGVHADAEYDALEPAVQHAASLAEPGDVVLLSPACASFGMFVNEFDRGEQFRRVVGALR
jgi:UDP-N-acetylmuramoylalanine--D-glutamate ligase